MSYTDRNTRLISLAQMVVHGNIIHKLDYIASVYINCRYYFNVFRRYNSPYNFIIEDANGDIHLHQDHTVRTSLQSILCLSELDSQRIYTLNATSFKQNGPVETMARDFADMRWSQIQAEYHAVNVNFGGIFEQYHSSEWTPLPQETTPSDDYIKSEEYHTPTQPMTNLETANILLTISIPPINEAELLRQDSQQGSVHGSSPGYVCYCEMDEDLDEEDESNYTVLRSGTMIPKQTR
jgi:hypothetical protein